MSAEHLFADISRRADVIVAVLHGKMRDHFPELR